MNPFGKHTRQEIINTLGQFLGFPVQEVAKPGAMGDFQPDIFLKGEGHYFAIEWKSNSYPQSLAPFLRFLEIANLIESKPILLLCVPFMGPGGRNICEQSDFNWFDLSGNGRIMAPGLHIHIEGKPDLFKQPGRKPNLFAPKSSRIARHLLQNPYEGFSQRELSQLTEVDEGHASKIIKRLVESKLLYRDNLGKLLVENPNLLLTTWRESYDFSRHRIIKGHIAARSGSELLKKIALSLREDNIDHAATGLASAWLYTHFASFRIVSMYINDIPESSYLEKLGFREEEVGANTWLILPNDAGVLEGSREIDGINCASPLQTYLDLKGHPERSKEASEEMKKQYLSWSDNRAR